MEPTVGTVTATPSKDKDWKSFEVRFDGFANLPATKGEYVLSPEFTCFGHQSRLWIYPGGILANWLSRWEWRNTSPNQLMMMKGRSMIQLWLIQTSNHANKVHIKAIRLLLLMTILSSPLSRRCERKCKNTVAIFHTGYLFCSSSSILLHLHQYQWERDWLHITSSPSCCRSRYL